MAEDFQKNIVVSVTTDTGEATKDLSNLKNKIDDIGDAKIDQPFKNLKTQLKDANNEAQKMADTFGKQSKEFGIAAQKVADLKDEFGKYKTTVEAFNPDNKLQAVVGVARGAVGAIQGVSGAMAFLGVESEGTVATIAKLQGLMAFSDALNSLEGMKDSFTSLGSVIKASAAYQAINNGLTKAATFLQTAFGIAVDETAVSFKVLKGAIAATGIGLLIVALGELVAHWDDITKAMSRTTQAEKNLLATNEEVAKGMETVTKNVNNVRVAFDLARTGVISKDKALKIYNDSLGDAFGKTNDLGKAEKLFLEKVPDYIEGMRLKTRANALFAAAAAETAKGIVAATADNSTWWDAFLENSPQRLKEVSDKNAVEIKKNADKNAALLNTQAEKDLTAAGEIFKKGQITVDLLDGGDKGKTAKALAESNYKELQAALAGHLANMKKIQDDANAKNLESLSARNKELVEADLAYNAQKKELDKNLADSKAVLDKEKNLKPGEAKKLNEQELANQKAHDEASADLLQQYRANWLSINTKFDASDLAEADKQAEFLASISAAGVDRSNRPDPNDTPEQAKAKLKNKFDSGTGGTEDVNAKFKSAKDAAIGNQQELTDLQIQFDSDELTRKQDYDDAIKAIDDDTTQHLKDNQQSLADVRQEGQERFIAATVSTFNSAADIIDEIAGKQTVTGKVLAIASASINAFEGITKALAKSNSPFFAVRIAEAIAIGAFGLAQVIKIINTKIPKQSSGSGGTAPTISAPQVSQTLLDPSIANKVSDVRVINNNQTPIKAYITQTDLTNNQQKQDLFNRLSSI